MLKKIEGWQMWTSDAKFNLVKETLTQFILSFQRALVAENASYRQKLNQLETDYKEKSDRLKRNELDSPNAEARRHAEEQFQRVSDGWSGPSGVYTRSMNELAKAKRACTYRQGMGFFDRRKIKRSKSNNTPLFMSFQQGEQNLQKKAKAVSALIEQLREASEQISKAQADYNTKKYKAHAQECRETYERDTELLLQSHKSSLEQIVEKYQGVFFKYFNAEALRTADASAASLMAGYENYTCPDNVRSAMYFGHRTFVVSTGGVLFEAAVIGMIKSLNHSAFRVSADNTSIYVTLPYCRTLQEGYSVFVLCGNPDSAKANELIRAYTMKVYMNHPVDRFIPLLIDSASTPTFSVFAAIGDQSGKLNTRSWRSPDDVEKELRKITAEHNHLVGSYGEDVESRLEREPVYFVGCRNFPEGITETALHEMDVIWRAGSGYGFFGIVTANASGFDKFRNREPIEQMKKHSLLLEESGSAWLIKNSGDTLQFDCMPDLMNNKDLFSYVLSRIIDRVSNPKQRIEKFETLFSKDAGNMERIDVKDVNSWQRGNAAFRCDIPIGIFGANTVQKLTLEGTKQHALIAGTTGAGKSCLLRTLIMAAMIKYDPDNVNFYLIDFKEGVEFAPFARYNLPWIKMIAVNTEREFARSILRELEREFRNRAEIMTHTLVTDIGRSGRESFPRIILVVDEIQELLGVQDDITIECAEILYRLVSEGRAMNMNVILASQTFNNCYGIDKMKVNMAIRITFPGNKDSSESIMDEDFSAVRGALNTKGFAAISTDGGSKNQISYFNVGLLSDAERDDILKQLTVIYSHRNSITRILSRKASMDINNRFNRLILHREYTPEANPEEYQLMIGEFSINRRLIRLAPRRGDNLLIVGANTENAQSVCVLAIMSFLYDELTCSAEQLDNELVRIVDASYENTSQIEDDGTQQTNKRPDLVPADFSFMSSVFPMQVSRVDHKNMEKMINDTYDQMQRRISGTADKKERLLLVLFGVGGLMQFWQNDRVGMYRASEMTLSRKIADILRDGPEVGINTIIWSNSMQSLNNYLENSTIDNEISMRLFYGANTDKACEALTGAAPDASVLESKIALYRNTGEINAQFMRIYGVPEESWVRSFADVYAQMIEEKRGN